MGKVRYYFLDALRGGLVIFMIAHHICFNASLFGVADPKIFDNAFWNIIQPIGAALFIIISGVSSGFSKNNLKRGIKILACALLVTAATYIFDPTFYVKFGVLHLLGVCAVLYHFLAPLLSKLNVHPAVYAVLFFITKYLLSGTFSVRGLSWLGFLNESYVSSDYFPVFPYLFAYFFGISLVKYIKKYCGSPFWAKLRCAPLEYVGTHSLWFYLGHQPIIVGIFYLYKFVNGG